LKRKIIILVIIFVLIFVYFYYKIFFNGNNIIKPSKEEIVESILSDKLNYKAIIKVKVFSNKNENEYEIEQEENDNHSYLKVIKSNDISGLIVEETKEKLVVKNTNLSLEKVYENYEPIINNCLFLSSFIEDYNNENKIEKYDDNNNNIIKIDLKNSSKYIKYKELYLDKLTGLPKKLVIKSSSKNTVICIEYTNIEIL